MSKFPVYNDHYKEELFWIWYNSGKCSASQLVLKAPKSDGNSPNITTLTKWIGTWRERADELDQEVKDQFTAQVIETKVEMLRRHAQLGKDLQQVAWDWLTEHRDELTASAVVRLIKDGYEMERASVGVPEALTKMLSVSDEELIKQIEDAMTGEDLELFHADK